MIGPKRIGELKLILIAMAFVAGVYATGEAGPRLSEEDRGPHPWETVTATNDTADAGSQLLAMKGAGEEDRQELQALLEVLEEETEVATKSKMNNDYVPGMVTVLHGDRLEALGVRSAAEALSLVPGIQVARLRSGEPTLKVRGVAFPFNAGNVKVMLNSIPMSRESSGINSSVLLTPVAQIERIEVIRGPGSSIYGDFAMAGVVNIITRNTGGRVFAQGGDDQSLGGGGHYTYRDEARDLDIGLNISAADDGENAAALDQDPDEERFTGVFNFNLKKFSLTAEGVHRALDRRINVQLNPPPVLPGDPPLPPPAGLTYRDVSRAETSWVVEARQGIDLGPKAGMDVHLSYQRNEFDADAPLTKFEGDRIETEVDLNWSPWARHQFLLGASYANSTIDDALQNGAGGLPPLQVSGVDRANYGITLQDQMTLTERFSLTLGARYDDYDDVGSLVTPRIGAVYRPAEHHVVKAQYSEGFRTPTFWELYATGEADENLDFEVMRTTELSYIYRRAKSVARATVYYSRIDNGLYRTGTGNFGNVAVIDAKGIELEWEEQLSEMFHWQANLSYNDTSDGRTLTGISDDGSPGVTDWLGNLAIFFKPLPKLVIAGRLLHVGDRYSTAGWIDGYDTVDVTISRTDLWQNGLNLRVGVKNVFDDTVVYLTKFASALTDDEYRGRTFWLQLSYDF